MPTAPTFPGVYIEEVPSGVRTIVGVSTSVGAFVDRFDRGPVDAAVRIFGMADFEREFGGLITDSEASYAIRQFFLNGGTEAHVVRADTVGGGVADLLLQSGSTDIIQVSAGRRVGRRSVADPGEWGNALHVEIDYATTDPAALFNLTVSEVADENGRMLVLRTETFRNLTLEPGAENNALEVVNAGSKMIQLAELVTPPDPFDPTFRPNASGTLSGALAATPGNPVVADGAEIDIIVNPGGGAADLAAITATIDYGAAPPPSTYSAFRRFLEAAIRAADPLQPLLSGATVQLVGDRYRVLLGRAGAGFQPDATIRFAVSGSDTAATTLALTTAAGARANAQLFALDNGTDGAAPTEAELRGVRASKTGLYALEDADLFNILCIPAAANLNGADARAVYAEAEAYCEERRAFLLVDIPEVVNEVPEMETWLDDNAGLRHRNAAVYFPRVRIADPLNQNRLRSIPPSGTIAGLFASTDASRGVWKAPAGTEARLRNVQGLDYLLTDRENGVLNPVGVNCLRNFPIYGNVAWGARTLDGADVQASDWKYIPVRRLALFLEESLYRGTKWVVFEPNDEPLWAQIRLNIGAFMQSLFRQGAFQGRTPREAYLVKCDAETTTQDDINRGIVNIVVGFAPLKPAEFVIIRIQQLAGQVEA
jgi:phage tail sheath protein FI